MSAVNGIILYQNVLARAIPQAFLAGTALHANSVITYIDMIIDYQHVLTATDVKSVAVLGVPRAADGYSVDDYVVASSGNKMEFRRILYGHPAYEDILAISNSDKVRPHLFLFLRRFCYVCVML